MDVILSAVKNLLVTGYTTLSEPRIVPTSIERMVLVWTLLAWCAVAVPVARAGAQSDEIQVYTGELAAPQKMSLTLHANYTPRGRMMADFVGGVVPQGSVNGALELAYGVSEWFEAGAYLPVYTRTRDGTFEVDGVKARALFAVPHAEARRFFYGVNFEMSYNAMHWNQSRYGGEIRPIVGARAGKWDVIANPILDTSFDGFGALVLAPSFRVANNVTPTWALAIEHYSDFGPVRRLKSPGQQQQNMYAVTDFSRKAFSVELGVGYGFTDASDRVILKTILTRSF